MATCFVIQGFNKKQDYTTGRTLNLDASYEVIREAVIEAGLDCVRADEIRHSGMIDTPMYQRILEADLVIADLSTYNVNAAYELGIRHALRPFATIVVAESELKYPFDLNHIAITKYEHKGDDILYGEAKRFKRELVATIREVMARSAIDSPVYTFLPALARPTIVGGARSVPPVDGAAGAASVKVRIDAAKQAMDRGDFVTACRELLGVRDELREVGSRDDAVTQMLSLATYKSRQPDPVTALETARTHLQELDPRASHDAETLGLWGAIHKGLWFERHDPRDLSEAIFGYERGFLLRQDYYNGVNYAFLLNVRAKVQTDVRPAEAIADWVGADRVRTRIEEICENELATLRSTPVPPEPELQRARREKEYWVLATLEEVATGLRRSDVASMWHKQAETTCPASWMRETTAQQVAKISALMDDPPTRLLASS